MKWNCDAVDEATNNRTQSTVFFCSVKDNSAAAHSQCLVLLSVFVMFWLLTFCHYKYRQSLLFKHFKVSSNLTAIQWPYLVGVAGNICFGPTNNASVWFRLWIAERNAWSIKKHFHYQLHSLHILCTHLKSLIIFYACFVFYVFSVSLQLIQHSLNSFGKWYGSKNDSKKNKKVILISLFHMVFFIHHIVKLTV